MTERGIYKSVLPDASAHSYRQFVLFETDTPDS